MKPPTFLPSSAASVIAGAIAVFAGFADARQSPPGENDLIPPSTPLVACDPYFSIWSPGDKLTDVETTHWTGKKHPLTGVLQVDGTTLRVIGASPADAPALEQKSLTVLPTRTIYTFEGAGVALTLTFTTPALPDDMAILSRPVTYLTYDFKATDGKAHEVAVSFGAGGELAVNMPEPNRHFQRRQRRRTCGCKIGSKTQRVLGSKGDDHRIDWGYAYIAAPGPQQRRSARTLASVFASSRTTGAARSGDQPASVLNSSHSRWVPKPSPPG